MLEYYNPLHKLMDSTELSNMSIKQRNQYIAYMLETQN